MSRNAELRVPTLFRRGLLGVCFLTLLSVLLGLAKAGSTAAEAQGFIPHAATTPAPKVELFGGYSYLYPHTTATGYLPNGIVPVSTCLCSIPDGGGGSITYDFTPWLGVTVDGGVHGGAKSGTPAQTIGTASDSNVFVGPQIKQRHHHFVPFAEVLVGEDTLSPSVFPSNTAFGLLAGGGLDVGFGKHIGVRVFQADLLFSPHSFGAGASTEVGLRVQGGVVFSFGGAAPVAAPTLPAVVIPVAAPATVASAPVPVEVLTLTAQASPANMVAGESSTIMGNGVSSLGRPLTYSYSSTVGAISGTGATAILTTAGAAAGTAIVTVSVFDDMNQTAVATVPVVLEVPAIPAVPVAAVTSSLCVMSFARDRRRPARVDNEAKACLDGIALTLEHDSDAQLVLVGSASAGEPHRQRLAATRAANVKAYLVGEKGIEDGRVQLYTGSAGDKAVSSTLVPAGATPDTSGLSPVRPH